MRNSTFEEAYDALQPFVKRTHKHFMNVFRYIMSSAMSSLCPFRDIPLNEKLEFLL